MHYDEEEDASASGSVTAGVDCGFGACPTHIPAFETDNDMVDVPLGTCNGANVGVSVNTSKRCIKSLSGTTASARATPSASYGISGTDGTITATLGGETRLRAAVSGPCCGKAGATGSGQGHVSIVFEICETGCVTITEVISSALNDVDDYHGSGSWSISGPGVNLSGGLVLGDQPVPPVQCTITPGTYTFGASFDWSASVGHATDLPGGAECADAGPHDAAGGNLDNEVTLTVLEPCEESMGMGRDLYSDLNGDKLALLLADWSRCS